MSAVATYALRLRGTQTKVLVKGLQVGYAGAPPIGADVASDQDLGAGLTNQDAAANRLV